MEIKKTEANGHTIAVAHADSIVLSDEESALDLIMTISYETGSHRIALNKEAISEDFFNLSTKLAGDILQKFVTYKMKFAIVGNFSLYTSQALQDFIYECNNGNHIFFVPSEQEAIDKLAHTKWAFLFAEKLANAGRLDGRWMLARGRCFFPLPITDTANVIHVKSKGNVFFYWNKVSPVR